MEAALYWPFCADISKTTHMPMKVNETLSSINELNLG